MKFSASFDNITKFITLVTTVIILVASFMLWKEVITQQQYYLSIFAIVLLVVYVGAYLLSIDYYQLTDDALVIHRKINTVKIQRDQIESATSIQQLATLGNIRLIGNGGLFGYMGKYRNLKFGNYSFYGTQRKNLVLIKLKNGKQLVITPDQPHSLIDALS